MIGKNFSLLSFRNPFQKLNLMSTYSPDEHPFTPRSELPAPILPPLEYPPLLYDPTSINVNPTILSFYTQSIVPSITTSSKKDDGNYGSAGTRDLECLQAISRRIHCGMSFHLPPSLSLSLIQVGRIRNVCIGI